MPLVEILVNLDEASLLRSAGHDEIENELVAEMPQLVLDTLKGLEITGLTLPESLVVEHKRYGVADYSRDKLLMIVKLPDPWEDYYVQRRGVSEEFKQLMIDWLKRNSYVAMPGAFTAKLHWN